MTMRPTVEMASGAPAFYGTVRAFLTKHEADNNLLLGVLTGLAGGAARHDASPLLLRILVDGETAAVAVRQAGRNLILSHGAQAFAPLLARHLHEAGNQLPGVIGPAGAAASFTRTWQELTGQQPEPHLNMRVYRLTEVEPVREVPGYFRLAGEEDRELLAAWVQAFASDALNDRQARQEAERVVAARLQHQERGLAVWCDQDPVSMAGFTGPTPNGIRVNLVYTPPPLRRRGYASAVVAALSQHLLDTGYRFCFLFTDLNNPTSNRIYQRIGYRPVADMKSFRFSS